MKARELSPVIETSQSKKRDKSSQHVYNAKSESISKHLTFINYILSKVTKC